MSLPSTLKPHNSKGHRQLSISFYPQQLCNGILHFLSLRYLQYKRHFHYFFHPWQSDNDATNLVLYQSTPEDLVQRIKIEISKCRDIKIKSMYCTLILRLMNEDSTQERNQNIPNLTFSWETCDMKLELTYCLNPWKPWSGSSQFAWLHVISPRRTCCSASTIQPSLNSSRNR